MYCGTGCTAGLRSAATPAKYVMTRRSLSAAQRILQLDCDRPLRQWVLSLPYALRFLLAADLDSLTRVLRTVYRAIHGFLIQEGGAYACHAHPGAVTLIQRFGSALTRTHPLSHDLPGRLCRM
jgi:hypothetical protein